MQFKYYLPKETYQWEVWFDESKIKESNRVRISNIPQKENIAKGMSAWISVETSVCKCWGVKKKKKNDVFYPTNNVNIVTSIL